MKYEKVAMFCHGGTFAVSMARIFNLTIPFTMVSFPMRQTAIARIELLSKEGELVNPRFLCVNDVAHLVNCGIELTD